MPLQTIRSLQEIVKQILADVASSAGAAMALVDLAAADSYTFQHSIDVTALGLLIGSACSANAAGWTSAACASSTASTSACTCSASVCCCTTSASSRCPAS